MCASFGEPGTGSRDPSDSCLMVLSVFTGGEGSIPWRDPKGAANVISSLMPVSSPLFLQHPGICLPLWTRLLHPPLTSPFICQQSCSVASTQGEL